MEVKSIVRPIIAFHAWQRRFTAKANFACAFVAGGLLLCSIPPEHFANELFQGENALARNAGLIFLINIPLEKCKIFLVFVNIFTLPRAAMPRIDVSGALAYILK